MVMNVSIVLTDNSEWLPARYAATHPLPIIQRDDETTITAIFSVNEQSCPNNSDGWKTGRECRRHKSTGAKFRLRTQEELFAHFAADDDGVLIRKSPDGIWVAVVSKLEMSRPCPASVNRN